MLAGYTEDGELSGFEYVPAENLPIGATEDFTFNVDNSNGETKKLKAFCWESFESLVPFADPVGFPNE